MSVSFCLQPARTLQRPTELTRGDYSENRQYITRLIEDKMVEHDIVGLSIALVDDQHVVWAEGFGWADEQRKIKATPETVYRTGSITKLFTATAAMQLDEQGRMDIDQPLQNALPQFAIKSRFPNAGPVTPRNIMTHHSGLPSDYLNGMWTEKPAEFTQLVVRLKEDYMAYPPDTILSYSNAGMTLLGHAVQHVSGRPYGEQIEQALLVPMGMSHSYIAATLKDDRRSSKGYSDNKEITALPLRDLPAGGLNSTVLDLARLTQMVFANGRAGQWQILKSETLNEMLRYQDGEAPFDLEKRVGLGWFLDDQFGSEAGLIAAHDGGTFLFHSSLMTLPRHQLAVVVLANSASAAPAVTAIAEEALKLALETKTGIRVQEPKEVSAKGLPARTEDLQAFPGHYSTPLGLVEIERRGDRLKVIADDESFNLVRREDGHYHLQYKLLGLWPVGLGVLGELGLTHGEVAGCDVLIAHHEGHEVLAGEKILPKAVPEAWSARVGHYEVIDPQPGLTLKDVALHSEEGLLVLEFGIQLPHLPNEDDTERLALVAVNDREAVVHGLGRGKGGNVQVTRRSDEELLSYSGFLLRRKP
ncbi:MAG: serine hydrolase domain-containing protein [Gammaproteobacteria bacterium]